MSEQDMHPIRAYRKKAGLLQAEFAELVNVKKAAVSRWEAGQPVGHTNVRRVHEITGIPLHELRPDLYPAPEKVG